ncbi:hypothetical protein BKA80DRAFT_277910 [Phyllosticta citrichinensis]
MGLRSTATHFPGSWAKLGMEISSAISAWRFVQHMWSSLAPASPVAPCPAESSGGPGSWIVVSRPVLATRSRSQMVSNSRCCLATSQRKWLSVATSPPPCVRYGSSIRWKRSPGRMDRERWLATGEDSTSHAANSAGPTWIHLSKSAGSSRSQGRAASCSWHDLLSPQGHRKPVSARAGQEWRGLRRDLGSSCRSPRHPGSTL